ncbi:MAG: hypothetical protein MZV64_13875 [Ignavibacteriales bacterium]|nr:hypothetical protein [Ignavibacteriales bacterium]
MGDRSPGCWRCLRNAVPGLDAGAAGPSFRTRVAGRYGAPEEPSRAAVSEVAWRE